MAAEIRGPGDGAAHQPPEPPEKPRGPGGGSLGPEKHDKGVPDIKRPDKLQGPLTPPDFDIHLRDIRRPEEDIKAAEPDLDRIIKIVTGYSPHNSLHEPLAIAAGPSEEGTEPPEIERFKPGTIDVEIENDVTHLRTEPGTTFVVHGDVSQVEPRHENADRDKEIDVNDFVFPPFRYENYLWRPADPDKPGAYAMVDGIVDTRTGYFALVGLTHNGPDGLNYHFLGPDQTNMASAPIGRVKGIEGDTSHVISDADGSGKRMKYVSVKFGGTIDLSRSARKKMGADLVHIPLTDEDLQSGVSMQRLRELAAAHLGGEQGAESVSPQLAFERDFKEEWETQRRREVRGPLPPAIMGLEQRGEHFVPRGTKTESGDTHVISNVSAAYDVKTGLYAVLAGDGNFPGQYLVDGDFTRLYPEKVDNIASIEEDGIVVRLPRTDKFVKITQDGAFAVLGNTGEGMRVKYEHKLERDLVKDKPVTADTLQDKLGLYKAPKPFQISREADVEAQTTEPGLHEGWKFGPMSSVAVVARGDERKALFGQVFGVSDPDTGEVAVVGSTSGGFMVLDNSYMPIARLDSVFGKSLGQLKNFGLPEEGFTGADIASFAANTDGPEPKLAAQKLLDKVHARREKAVAQYADRVRDPRYLPQELGLFDLSNPDAMFPEIVRDGEYVKLKDQPFGHQEHKYNAIEWAYDPKNNCIVPIGVNFTPSGDRGDSQWPDRFVINPQTFEPLTRSLGRILSISDSRVSTYGSFTRDRIITADGEEMIHEEAMGYEIALHDITDELVVGHLSRSSMPESIAMDAHNMSRGLTLGLNSIYAKRLAEAKKQPDFVMPGQKEFSHEMHGRVVEELKKLGNTISYIEVPALDNSLHVRPVDAGGFDERGKYHGNGTYDLAFDTRTRAIGIIMKQPDGVEYLVNPETLDPLTPGVDKILAMGSNGVSAIIGSSMHGISTANETQLQSGSLYRIAITDAMTSDLTGKDLKLLADAVAGTSDKPWEMAFQTAYTAPDHIQIVVNVVEQDGVVKRDGRRVETDLDAFVFPAFRSMGGEVTAPGHVWIARDFGADLAYKQVLHMVDPRNGQFAFVGMQGDGNSPRYYVLGPDQSPITADVYEEIAGFDSDGVHIIGRRAGDKGLQKINILTGEATKLTRGERARYKNGVVSEEMFPESAMPIDEAKRRAGMMIYSIDSSLTPELAFADVFSEALRADRQALADVNVFSEETYQFPKFYVDRAGRWHGEVTPGHAYEQMKLVVDKDGRIALAGVFTWEGEQHIDIIGPTQDRLGVSMREIQGFDSRYIIGAPQGEHESLEVPLNAKHTSVRDMIQSKQGNPHRNAQTQLIDIPAQLLEQGLSVKDMKALAAAAINQPPEKLSLAYAEAFSRILGVPHEKDGQMTKAVARFAEAYRAMWDGRADANLPTSLPATMTLPGLAYFEEDRMFYPVPESGEAVDESRSMQLFYTVDTETGIAALVSAEMGGHDWYKKMYIVGLSGYERLHPGVENIWAYEPDGIIVRVGERKVAIRDSGITDLGWVSASEKSTIRMARVSDLFVDHERKLMRSVTMDEVQRAGESVISGLVNWGAPAEEKLAANAALEPRPYVHLPVLTTRSALDLENGELDDHVVIGSRLPESIKRGLQDQFSVGPHPSFSIAVDTETNQFALVEVSEREVPHEDPDGHKETMAVPQFYVVNHITGARQTEVGVDQLGMEDIVRLESSRVTGVQQGEVVVIDNGRFDILDTTYKGNSSVRMLDVTEAIANGTLTGVEMKRLASELSGIDGKALKLVDPRAGRPVQEKTGFRHLSPEVRASILTDALGAVVANESLPPDFRQNLIEANSFLIGLQGGDEAIDEERLAQGAKFTNAGTWRAVSDALSEWKNHQETYNAEAAAQYLNQLDPKGNSFGNAFNTLAVPDMETFEVLVEYLMAREIAQGVDPEKFAALTDLRLSTIVEAGAHGVTDVFDGGRRRLSKFMRRRSN